MNFSRFSAFSTITGPAERKNSLQMRRFQTISEFSHGLGREVTVTLRARPSVNGGRWRRARREPFSEVAICRGPLSMGGQGRLPVFSAPASLR
jgi:hypothetical protein